MWINRWVCFHHKNNSNIKSMVYTSISTIKTKYTLIVKTFRLISNLLLLNILVMKGCKLRLIYSYDLFKLWFRLISPHYPRRLLGPV